MLFFVVIEYCVIEKLLIVIGFVNMFWIFFEVFGRYKNLGVFFGFFNLWMSYFGE